MALNVEEWMKLNTAYCKRLCVWLSAKACEINSQYSNSAIGDSRCYGCNGLNDQALPLEVILNKSLHLALEEVLEADTLTENDFEDDLDILEISAMDESELDAALAELLPEYEVALERAVATSERNTRPVKVRKVKKVAVYLGRCLICGGYMVFAPERQFDEWDDEVYRCYSCGWRTSPQYEWNRNNV